MASTMQFPHEHRDKIYPLKNFNQSIVFAENVMLQYGTDI
jgi:hypothetical protein